MILRLKDGTETSLTTEEVGQLETMLNSETKIIKIGNLIFDRAMFAVIKPGGHTQADVIDDRSHLLDRPDYRGRFSPAKEALRKKWKID